MIIINFVDLLTRKLYYFSCTSIDYMDENGRIKTYIEKFDDVLKGGIPEGHIVLICGSAGTYKSSISLNMLTNNVDGSDHKGFYISFEEPKESLLRTAEKLNLKKWKQNELLIADIGELRIEHRIIDDAEEWFKMIKEYIQKRVDEGFDIMVLDSLSALYSLVEFENPRKQIFRFMGYLRQLGITVFLISEVYELHRGYSEYCEDFLADGIILLRNFDISETESQLRIKCVKMRHVEHSKDFYTLFQNKGTFEIARVISQGDRNY